MPATPNLIRPIPTAAVTQTFLNHISEDLKANTPEWFPCLKEGCCDGKAGCCRTGMINAIPWTEAELIWLEIEKMPVAQRRKIAAESASQCAHARNLDPVLFADLETNEAYVTDSVTRLNKVMLKLEDRVCPLLGIPEQIGNNGVSPARPYACSVYASRPAVCRWFGQSSASVALLDENGSVILNADGRVQTEAVLTGCEITHSTFQEKLRAMGPDAEVALLSGSTFDAVSKRLASPKLGDFQMPMVMKPIPFWIESLTDPTGDITNPDNVFNSIRAMMGQAITAHLQPPEPPTPDLPDLPLNLN